MRPDGVGTARSLLFVPGDRPDRFAKAVASGADAVVLDLEDAVAPARKEAALAHVVDFLDRHAKGESCSAATVVVRVNPPGTETSQAELTALAAAGAARVVMVPKAESAASLQAVLDALPAGSGTIPLVETAAGLLDVREVASARGVLRLAFGHLDLCAQLGLSPDDARRLEPARFALVVASAAASLPPPIDGVSTSIDDEESTTRATQAALESGFTGKLCIHPRQVALVHDALRPADVEVAWARRVTDAVGRDGVAQVDGEFVDRPVVIRAGAILARAGNAAQ